MSRQSSHRFFGASAASWQYFGRKMSCGNWIHSACGRDRSSLTAAPSSYFYLRQSVAAAKTLGSLNRSLPNVAFSPASRNASQVVPGFSPPRHRIGHPLFLCFLLSGRPRHYQKSPPQDRHCCDAKICPSAFCQGGRFRLLLRLCYHHLLSPHHHSPFRRRSRVQDVSHLHDCPLLPIGQIDELLELQLPLQRFHRVVHHNPLSYGAAFPCDALSPHVVLRVYEPFVQPLRLLHRQIDHLQHASDHPHLARRRRGLLHPRLLFS
mmetsp:Transcript_33954/g.52960  ORF Transcript_33954/g.52960 Transcript_33954/m.52960 type:complete len:264 (+) Transcript_33954:472-1263(+)